MTLTVNYRELYRLHNAMLNNEEITLVIVYLDALITAVLIDEYIDSLQVKGYLIINFK